MTKSLLQDFPSRYLIQINGDPIKVATEVNRLFNFGIVHEPPADYHENDDYSVILASNRRKFLKGLLDLAECEIKAENGMILHRIKKNKAAFKRLTIFKAARMLREFSKRPGAN